MRGGHDRGQRVAQVVADDADEMLAEARRPRRLRFPLLAIADVHQDGDGAGNRPARISQRRHGKREVDLRPVLAPAAHLAIADHLTRERLLLDCRRLLPQVGRHQRKRLSEDLDPGPTEQLFRGAVPDLHPAVAIDRHDRQGGCLDQRLERAQGVLEARLRTLAREERCRPRRDGAKEALFVLIEFPGRLRGDAQCPEHLFAQSQRHRVHGARALAVRDLDDRSLIDGPRGHAVGTRRFRGQLEASGCPHHQGVVLGDQQRRGVRGKRPFHGELRKRARRRVG